MKTFSSKTKENHLKLQKKDELNVCQNPETLIKVEQKKETRREHWSISSLKHFCFVKRTPTFCLIRSAANQEPVVAFWAKLSESFISFPLEIRP